MFQNETIRVGLSVYPPYIEQCAIDNWDGGPHIASCDYGVGIDLLDNIFRYNNFTNFELVVTDRFGIQQPDGSWDGLIGKLIAGKIDVVPPVLALTPERYEALKFMAPSLPVIFATPGLIINPNKELVAAPVLKPFSIEVWLGMIVSFAFIVNYITILRYYRTKMVSGKINFKFTRYAAALSKTWYSVPFLQKKLSLWRFAPIAVMMIFYTLMSKVMLQLYGALVVKILIPPLTTKIPFSNQYGMIDAIENRGYRLVLLNQSTHDTYDIHYSNESYFIKLRQILQQFPPVYKKNIPEAFSYVKNNPGTVMSIDANTAFYMQRLACDLIIVADESKSVDVGSGAGRNRSSLMLNISSAIYKLAEHGIVEGIYERYNLGRAGSRNRRTNCLQLVKAYAPLNILAVYGCIRLWGIGLAFAIAIGFVELVGRWSKTTLAPHRHT